MTPEIKSKIQRILNYIETSSENGNYGKISLFEDGPNGIKQITYGKTQTTEWGNLSKLIRLYIQKSGIYSKQFMEYVDSIGLISLVNNENFIKLLKIASTDSIMHSSQDEFFDLYYWKPALNWFNENGFKLPLSLLVIYDSYIHSGGILGFLRQRFREVPPQKGGDEKQWINAYLKCRHFWLENHSNPDLVKSSYRTRDMIRAMTEDNWLLNKKYFCNGAQIS